MKIACKVHGKDALIVGYAPGRRRRIHAIVIVEGKMKAVRLKSIELPEVAERISGAENVTVMEKSRAA